jgi:esterase/lipase superfamily enzyme
MITRSLSPPTPDPACADIKPGGRVSSLALAAALAGGSFVGAVAAEAPATVAGVGDEIGMEVSVPYVTNRRPEAGGPGQTAYGGERGSPGFGRCSVTFTPIPVIDQIARRIPFYVADETREVTVAHQAAPEAFWTEVQDEIARTASGSVVVFVHGYSYGFERHCKAAAELQRTLSGKAVVLMFSWPSNGRPTDYIPDQADVEWSVPFLARVLAELGDRLGPERVQVLAHSLGSRGVIFALERLGAELETRPLIGRLVLMAPDFDAQTFVERLPDLVPLTAGITLYASSNDTPLKASRQLHDSPRLGEAGEFLTVAEGMQTVDVSPLGRYQALGHEYFRYHPKAAADLAELLGEGRSAPERAGLRPKRRDGPVYWELVGDESRNGAGDDPAASPLITH